jgi:hypothetical protein
MQGGNESSVVATDKNEEYRYDIKLFNRSEVPMDNIQVEYNIFYEQDQAVRVGSSSSDVSQQNDRGGPPQGDRGGSQQSGTYSVKSGVQTKGGKSQIQELGRRNRRTLQTDSVVILNRSATSEAQGELIDLEGDLKGIWVKVSMRAPDGTLRIRDIAQPPQLSRFYDWAPIK